MSQHDQNIANDTGAAVRGDINNALAALFGLSSGASAPTTTIAYMLWADTTSGLLKQRNAANTGWLVRGTLAETFVIARSSDTILGAGDHKRVIIATGTFTQTLTAAATLGDGWRVGYRNDGSGVITIDPNSTEQIDGGTTNTLQPGEACLIHCNGTAFKTIGRRRINDLTEDATPDPVNDYTETWDASAGAHKKVKLNNLAGGLKKLASGSVSAAATLDIDMTSYTAYPNKLLVLKNFVPATDGVALYLRTSTDGGATFAAGAGDYHIAANGKGSAGTASDLAGATAQIQLNSASLDNTASSGGINGTIRLYGNDLAVKGMMTYEMAMWNSAASEFHVANGAGSRNAAGDIDALRLLFSSGNIATGDWALYAMV